MPVHVIANFHYNNIHNIVDTKKSHNSIYHEIYIHTTTTTIYITRYIFSQQQQYISHDIYSHNNNNRACACYG